VAADAGRTPSNDQEETMQPRFRRVAVFVGAAAIAGGAGVGVAAQNGSSSASTAAAIGRPGGPGGPGGPGRIDAGALARRLGVSTARLQAAMEKSWPGAPPAGGSRGSMAADLAKALGLSTAKVQAALDATRPARPAATTTTS
jgi:hypothetical protein